MVPASGPALTLPAHQTAGVAAKRKPPGGPGVRLGRGRIQRASSLGEGEAAMLRDIADCDASSACTMAGIVSAVVVVSTRQRRNRIRNTLLPKGRLRAPSAFIHIQL
jgi:hypothetical protein